MGVDNVVDMMSKRVVVSMGGGAFAGGDPPQLPPGDGREPPDNGPRGGGFDVEAMNKEWALVLMGSKALILREQPDAPVEDRLRLLSIDAFRAWYRNKFISVKVGDEGNTKRVTFADLWLGNKNRRQYSGIVFLPGDDAVVPEGYYNLWRGFSVEPKEGGSYAIFKDHILTNVCGGDKARFDWVFGWFAHIVQRPRERLGTALVLRGKMGTGKTKIGEVFGNLISSHYFLVDDPRYVTGQFNAHMGSCLLLQADEAVWAGDKAAEGRLKGLVTSKFQMIEQKGIDSIRVDNFLRLIMTSNEDWVVPAGKDERRFCVLDIAPNVAQNTGYFAEMDEELANGGYEALLADLLAFDISKVNLRQVIKTDALREQKVRSLESVDSWWLERLIAGAPTRNGDVWPPDVAFEAIFDDYIATSEKIGIKRKSEATAFGMKMRKLVPGITRFKGYTTSNDSLKRKWMYRLPHLAQCRAEFETAIGQVYPWDDDEAGTEGVLLEPDGG